jgi:hypothetical protein
MPRQDAIFATSLRSQLVAASSHDGRRSASAVRPSPYPALAETLQNPRLIPRKRVIVAVVHGVGLFRRSR